ncbi:MAG: hypothetical protein KDA96_09285 [Planctomycetaceae bacterium]|nr:hypothetical protein [Planctomycetaceae bacterium]
MDWIAVISRWTHVGTAIIFVGGTFFLRFILTPVLDRLPDVERSDLTRRILRAWKNVVHTGMMLFIVSGFYNYLIVAVPTHKGDKLYHPLIGLKIILAFGMFFVAIALVGKSSRFDGMRRNAKFWQNMILVIALVIVGISGFAKVMLKSIAPIMSDVLH